MVGGIRKGMRTNKTHSQKNMMNQIPQQMALSPQQPLNRLRIPVWSARARECRAGGVVIMCTVNVGTMVGRSREMVEMLARR
jgi:hypothetical protein